MKGRAAHLVISTSLALMIAIPAACGPGATVDTIIEDEIEDTLKEFYESLAGGNLRDLEDFAIGGLASFLESADQAQLADFFAPYGGVEFDQLDDLDLDGKEGEAEVSLKRGAIRLVQELELQLDQDAWKIAALGELRPGDAPRDAQGSLRDAADSLLAAMRDDDPEAIRALATEDYLAEDLQRYFDDRQRRAAGPPEELERYRRLWASLQWEYLRIEPFKPQPDEGIVTAKVVREDGTVNWRISFRLVDGEWKWTALRSATDEDLQQPAAARQPRPRPALSAAGDCSDAIDIKVGVPTRSFIIGTAELYYRFEISGAGTYSIFSTGETDTIGILKDSECGELEENDDDGPGPNFLIVRNLEEGTYYIVVRGFTEDQSGAFELRIEAGEREAEPDDPSVGAQGQAE